MAKITDLHKIIVTGGAGFIGSQLAHHFSANGVPTHIVDDLSFGYLDNLVVDGKTFGQFHCKNVNDTDLATQFEGAEIVFHFAGISSLPFCQVNPTLAYHSNVAGTANILELSRKHGVKRVVFASTSAVYESNTSLPFGENDIVAPNLIYSLTKQSAEQICQSYVTNYGLDVVITRLFNIYGPHQDIRRQSPPFTSYLAREVLLGRNPVLFNQSEIKRDYVYIDDVINALEVISLSPQPLAGEVLNIASGHGYSVPEILAHFETVSGRRIVPTWQEPAKYWDGYSALFSAPFPLSRERIKKEVFKASVGDPSKLAKLLDWKPQISIEQGLANIWNYAARTLSA